MTKTEVVLEIDLPWMNGFLQVGFLGELPIGRIYLLASRVPCIFSDWLQAGKSLALFARLSN